MNSRYFLKTLALCAAGSSLALAQAPPPQKAPPQPMGFFVTSAGPGKGADLGGLAGADRHCQTLAAAAGGGNRTWHAYLSTSGASAVNARDRIGSGPWHNAKGARVAQGLSDLHGDTLEQAQLGNNVNKGTAIDEKGNPIKGVGDTPNQHDILTGSTPAGKAYTDAADHTCGNWSSSTAGSGAAQVGHFDRNGGSGNISWNSTHASRGCSQENLVSTGGNGLFYCFAIN